MDCSPPGSSIHRVFQERILEQVAISYSRGSSGDPGIESLFLSLLYWQAGSLQLHYLGSPNSCIQESHAIFTKKWFLKGTRALATFIVTRLGTERAGKHYHLPGFPWKGCDCNFTSCCRRVQLLMSMHLHTVLHVSLLRDQGSEWALSCLLPKAPSNNKAKVPVCYLRVSEKNCIHPGSNIYSCHSRNRSLHHLFLTTSGTQRTKSKK